MLCRTPSVLVTGGRSELGASLLYRVSSTPFLGKLRLKWLNTGKGVVGCKQMAVTNVQGLGTRPGWKKFCWEVEVAPFTMPFLL